MPTSCRADSQAVIVGAGTAIEDWPTLTARDTREPVPRQPLRVVLDARGRLPVGGPLFDSSLAPTLVITTAAAPEDVTSAWLAAGAKVQTVPPAPKSSGVDLLPTLEILAGHGVLQGLVEGGAQLAGALLDADLVDRLVTYVAPTILGRNGRPSFDIAGPATIADAPRLRLVDVTRLGNDVRLDYERPL